MGNFEAAKTLCDQMPIAPGPGDRTADGVEDLSRALELLLEFFCSQATQILKLLTQDSSQLEDHRDLEVWKHLD